MPAVSMPSPGLNGPSVPSRLRVPSGNRIRPHGSSMSRFFSSARACVPQFFRHIGSAFNSVAENSDMAGVLKKTSPAATGNTQSHSRQGNAAASKRASR